MMGQRSKSKQAPARRDAPENERKRRGDAAAPAPAEQFGATEKDVLPTTPPMAESDQLPGKPVRKSAADDEIDPNEELTPG